MGAYAPVSSAPESERELFLRNLQAAVESERDALLVVGGDFNAQLGVRQPDSLEGVRDTVRGPFGIPRVNRAGEALLDVLVSCPRHLCAVKPRIDRTLLEDPVVKLKSQSSMVDFIDRCGSERPVCCAYHTVSTGKHGCAYAAAWSSGR